MRRPRWTLQLCQPPEPQACAVPACCEPATALLRCKVWDLVGISRVMDSTLTNPRERLVPQYGPTEREVSFRVCRVHSHQLDLDSDWDGVLRTVDELRGRA